MNRKTLCIGAATLVLMTSVCLFAYAASGAFSGTWTITIDRDLDGVLVPESSWLLTMNSHHERFVAEYTTINNDAIFEGETFFDPARTTELIQFTVMDSTYFRVSAGRKVGNNVYEGTWYDNAGQGGDFRLEK